MERTNTSFTPHAPVQRSGKALCLSGGGFRAGLFHLGALTRLNELGVLSQLDTITSVSGGSILSAHIAKQLDPWPNSGQVVNDWNQRVVAPFVGFTKRNIRIGPIIRKMLTPWNWLKSDYAIHQLAGTYQKYLTDEQLSELPERPKFVFCATDLVFGVNWVFERERSGDYQAGYRDSGSDWLVARAVAASSCFPPVFNPMQLGLQPSELQGGKFPQGTERDRLVAGIGLSDGGVYDNMGLEPVWKDHQTVLVSDGGATFDFQAGAKGIQKLLRYTSVVGRQASSIRKRWLISNFIEGSMEGTYWGIGSATKNYGGGAPGGYSEGLAEGVIAEIRTDLDSFSDAESSVLQNHGYLLAEAAIKRHASTLVTQSAPLQVPYPEWMDEAKVRDALKASHKLRVLGHRK